MIKKILIFLPEFSSKKLINVPWKQGFEIAKGMMNLGIQVSIVTEKKTEGEIDGVKIINLNQSNLRHITPNSFEQINQFKPDIIYWFGNPYSGIYLKDLKLNLPIILHISNFHMLYNELKNLTLKEIFLHNRIQFLTAFFPLNQLVVSKLNHQNIFGIISANKAITDRLIKLGLDESKIKTSPLFYEMEFKKQLPIQTTNELTICYSGPLSTIRGSDIILNAIKILVDKGLKIKLLFLLRSQQTEMDKKRIKTIIKKKKIENHIETIVGILSKEELAKHIMRSDIVVIPTKYVWSEPPLTILEAMGLGKPVITSDVCGIKNMVKEYAITINPSAKEFALNIEKLTQNKEYQKKLGSSAEKFVCSLPGWNALAEWTLNQINEFYENWKK